MDTPYGPITVQKARQFAMPKEVADLLGVDVGSRVYYVVDEAEPRWARVVPEALLVEWMNTGESVTS